MLGNLLVILTEAEKYAAEKKFDVAVLLQSRLSPDQFNLIQQSPDRLRHREARRRASWRHREGRARSRPTPRRRWPRSRRASRAPSPICRPSRPIRSPSRPSGRITQPRWNGKSLSGEEFFVQHVIPNFYFHVTTNLRDPAPQRRAGRQAQPIWAPCPTATRRKRALPRSCPPLPANWVRGDARAARLTLTPNLSPSGRGHDMLRPATRSIVGQDDGRCSLGERCESVGSS